MNEIDEFLKVKREYHKLESEINGGMGVMGTDEVHVTGESFIELSKDFDVYRAVFSSGEYMYEFYFVHDGFKFFTLSRNEDFMPCE